MIQIELFILGIVFGSFLNVLIYRIPTAMTMKGRSKCPECKTLIKWYHNIPLLSWVFLKGKCAYCSKPIPVSLPLVELMGGLLILIIGYQYHFDITNIYFWSEYFIYLGLLTLATIDYKYKAIPDVISLPVLYLSIYTLTKSYDIISSLQIVLIVMGGVLLFKYTIELIFKKEMLGEGDIIIAGIMVGILQSYNLFYLAIYLSAIVILILSFLQVIIYKKSLKNIKIPLIPFLLIGTLISDVYGLEILKILYP